LRDGHWPPPRLLLRMMLALYQSARGRANAARACWWLGKAVPALAEIPVQASNREALPQPTGP
jgi:hypothetical protein